MIRAKRDIEKGEQIYDTYGYKSNYGFFLYYGMVFDGIKHNDEILLYLVLD